MQSNIQKGLLVVPAGETLTGKENLLVALNSSGAAVLPNAVSDLALYCVEEGAASGANAALIPLSPDSNIRVKLDGTIQAGQPVALAAIDGTEDGKVRAVPATAGVYFSPGVAEEDGADGQLLLVRPMPRLITVATTVDLGNANAEIGGLTFSASPSQAECNALRDKCEELADDVRAMHAALVTAGIVAVTA